MHKTGRVVEERSFKRRVPVSKRRASAPVAPPGLKAGECGIANAALKGRSSTTRLHNQLPKVAPRHGCRMPLTTRLCRNRAGVEASKATQTISGYCVMKAET